MTNGLFTVPISFHIFNRPEPTRKVFKQIRNLKPSKLFITADGPRETVKNDKEKCEEVISIVDKIDWDCDLYKNFSDKNKGSFKLSEGITWVFKHVDRAIILEDDCIPHQSFFRFCQELLNYYEDDERIALITGNNYLFGQYKTKYSYYFSRYTNMWGWATWKRAWKQIDFSMTNWPEFRDMGGLSSIFRKKHEVIYWQEIMQKIFDEKIEPHWDYLLMLSMYMNNSLAIKPSMNLINNLGYGSDATHFPRKRRIQGLEVENMCFPLIHPPFICKNIFADEFAHSLISGGRWQYEKNRIKKFLPKIMLTFYRKIKTMVNY